MCLWLLPRGLWDPGGGSCVSASGHPKSLLSDPLNIRPPQNHQEGTQACGPFREQTVFVDPKKGCKHHTGDLKAAYNLFISI